jgi:glycosyltransferase involved in cell wall biosynthesis
VDTVYLFTPKYPPSTGGAATFYSNLITTTRDELRYIIVTEYNSSESVRTRQENACIYRILPRIGVLPTYPRVLLEIVLVAVFSGYIFLKEDIGIIHAHASSFSVVSLAVCSIIYQVPLAYDCRDETFRTWVIQIGYMLVWFSCGSNIDAILTRNGIPKDRIIRLPVVNPNWVRDCRSVTSSQDVSEVIYVGSLRKSKGIILLAETFRILLEHGLDLHLTVVGDGPAEEEFREHCRRIKIKNYVTLTGSLNHKEAIVRMSKSNILVLPSESEGVPRVVLESQDVGTPVVATAVGGIPDVIENEKNGMLTDRTAESIAENILRLLQDDELYTRVVKNGFEDADERRQISVRKRLWQGYKKSGSFVESE